VRRYPDFLFRRCSSLASPRRLEAVLHRLLVPVVDERHFLRGWRRRDADPLGEDDDDAAVGRLVAAIALVVARAVDIFG
jgi:hypothetical protein